MSSGNASSVVSLGECFIFVTKHISSGCAVAGDLPQHCPVCAVWLVARYCSCFLVRLFAADSNAAMLYTNGTTWVNGSHEPRSSSAIFSWEPPANHIDAVANINEPGSTITVLSHSLVQFEGSSGTRWCNGFDFQGVATTAGNVKVAPAAFSWTEFNVSDVDARVRIAARKGDLTITDGKEVLTLAQGQETTRDDSSGDSDQSGKRRRIGKGEPFLERAVAR